MLYWAIHNNEFSLYKSQVLDMSKLAKDCACLFLFNPLADLHEIAK